MSHMCEQCVGTVAAEALLLKQMQMIQAGGGDADPFELQEQIDPGLRGGYDFAGRLYLRGYVSGPWQIADQAKGRLAGWDVELSRAYEEGLLDADNDPDYKLVAEAGYLAGKGLLPEGINTTQGAIMLRMFQEAE
jgi:hypothetical protein